ncbi:MAG TPA: NADH-quinone oxidoreductase subunit L [Opitutaceae bacterium]|nr:NADH-quinone oxidoreductase subunit L [Opitutaceae bacterium]
MSSVQLALLVFLLPLGSATLIALFLRRQGGLASLISVAACAGLAVAALMLSFGGHRFAVSMPWLQVGDFTLSIGIKFDDLAALMLAIVAVVGLCVHVFSLGYMHEDGARARYFGGLSIFMFSMVGIVFADNLFMMFLFWELVGFSSYTLINHYLQRRQAADAAKKAFITNRVGDWGFLLGIIWCYHALGTVNLTEIANHAHGAGAVIAAGIPLLLFCGAVGKSAQMPLQVWLPDAMEGPTPVSALIHAATMVAAGIYMLCRIEPLFAAADPVAFNVVMWIGTITAIYAALCAIVQNDIKKILAYSTLSQLGYMVAAFGLGELSGHHEGKTVVIAAGVGAAMFHLTTHAFFKALMFLGSGSVIHGMHHEQNIFKMGGLASKMFITFVTFSVGVLAIIGFPFLAGFFSKDAILYLALEKNTAVFAILAFTAVLTALYMVRLWRIVFFGQGQSDEANHAHESGASMLVPLIVLAVLSVAGGYVAIYRGAFDGVWSQIPHPPEEKHMTILLISIAVMLIGAVIGFVFYKPSGSDRLQRNVPGAFGALSALKESFDAIYNAYVTKIQQRFAMLLNGIDQIVVSGLIVRGLAGFVGLIGMGARALHVGSLHSYVYWFLIGVLLVWGFASGIF